MEQNKTYKRVLSIAGSDSGGGAGIQADIKTISACGCFATTAITAVTVQNTLGVECVFGLPTDTIEGQIDAVLSDIGTDSIKIGMLHSSEIVRCVAKMIQKYNIKNVVLDPVMVSTSGHKLITDDAISVLSEILAPLAAIITPNIPEAEILIGEKINTNSELPSIAQRLAEKYHTSIYLKAGHLTEDKLTDIFFNYDTKSVIELTSNRLHTQNTHGTGCTLSSALASGLALGKPLTETSQFAHDYLANAIVAGADYKIGKGHGSVKHFWKFW